MVRRNCAEVVLAGARRLVPAGIETQLDRWTPTRSRGVWPESLDELKEMSDRWWGDIRVVEPRLGTTQDIWSYRHVSTRNKHDELAVLGFWQSTYQDCEIDLARNWIDMYTELRRRRAERR